jgi:hypothetical protein
VTDIFFCSFYQQFTLCCRSCCSRTAHYHNHHYHHQHDLKHQLTWYVEADWQAVLTEGYNASLLISSFPCPLTPKPPARVTAWPKWTLGCFRPSHEPPRIPTRPPATACWVGRCVQTAAACDGHCIQTVVDGLVGMKNQQPNSWDIL